VDDNNRKRGRVIYLKKKPYCLKVKRIFGKEKKNSDIPGKFGDCYRYPLFHPQGMCGENPVMPTMLMIHHNRDIGCQQIYKRNIIIII